MLVVTLMVVMTVVIIMLMVMVMRLMLVSGLLCFVFLAGICGLMIHDKIFQDFLNSNISGNVME